MYDRPESSTLWQTFTGRLSDILALHEALRLPDRRPLWIVGPRGIGKSALSLVYEERYASAYAAIVHVYAGDLSDLRSIPALVAARLGGTVSDRVLRTRGPTHSESLSDFAEIFASLRTQSPVVLVIDDADAVPHHQLEHLLPCLERWPDRLRLILIARSEALRGQFSQQSRLLTLTPLTVPEMTALLRKRMAGKPGAATLAEEAVRALLTAPIDLARLTPRFLIRFGYAFLGRGELAAALSDTLFQEFREATTLVISAEKKRLRIIPTAALAPSDIVTPTERIIAATPLVVVPAFSSFWRTRLNALEELINKETIRESELQAFFEANELLLQGIDYERVIAHPVLKRDDDGDLIPDFFLKPHTTDLVDILDLKLPTEKLVVGANDRRRVSASVAEAVAQVREYRSYFELPVHRQNVRKMYGITGYRPGTVVVIGRSSPDLLTEESRRALDDLPHHVRLLTYDDLLARMRACLWAKTS